MNWSGLRCIRAAALGACGLDLHTQLGRLTRQVDGLQSGNVQAGGQVNVESQ